MIFCDDLILYILQYVDFKTLINYEMTHKIHNNEIQKLNKIWKQLFYIAYYQPNIDNDIPWSQKKEIIYKSLYNNRESFKICQVIFYKNNIKFIYDNNILPIKLVITKQFTDIHGLIIHDSSESTPIFGKWVRNKHLLSNILNSAGCDIYVIFERIYKQMQIENVVNKNNTTLLHCFSWLYCHSITQSFIKNIQFDKNLGELEANIISQEIREKTGKTIYIKDLKFERQFDFRYLTMTFEFIPTFSLFGHYFK